MLISGRHPPQWALPCFLEVAAKDLSYFTAVNSFCVVRIYRGWDVDRAILASTSRRFCSDMCRSNRPLLLYL